MYLNVNFVTPSHVAAQILEALPLAAEMGLRLPLIWNCGGYESLSTLRLLDGVVDIYMPDAKFTDPEAARTEAVRLGLRLDERRGLSPRLLRRLWGE